MSLFRAEGPFSHAKKEIFGITQINHIRKLYSITFKAENSAEQMHFFKRRFSTRQLIHLNDGTQIGITVQEPRPPATTITLHPVPFETPLEEIADIVTQQQWGKLLRQQFGHYREFPEFRNSYLHLLIEDIKENNIPEQITINEKPVEIIMSSRKRNKCNYCKAIGHNIQECPKKSTPPVQSKPTGKGIISYRNAVLNTPSNTTQNKSETNSTNQQDETTRLHKTPPQQEPQQKSDEQGCSSKTNKNMETDSSPEDDDQSDRNTAPNNSIMDTDIDTTTSIEENASYLEQLLNSTNPSTIKTLETFQVQEKRGRGTSGSDTPTPKKQRSKSTSPH